MGEPRGRYAVCRRHQDFLEAEGWLVGRTDWTVNGFIGSAALFADVDDVTLASNTRSGEADG